MSAQRIDRVITALRARGLDGLALMPAANLRYLSGLSFHQGKRLTLLLVPAAGGAPCFVIPALERTQAEANSQLGVALATRELDDEVVAVLVHVQNDLFDVGADLSCPVVENPEYPQLRVEPEYIERLEAWCDQYNEPLEKLRSFILPGGTPAAAQLHVARTVVRRAERSAWAALETHADSMNVLTAKYLNRLSDLLFILARYANRAEGDVLWVPGGER